MTKLEDYYSNKNNPINKPQQGLPGSPSTSIVTPNISISGDPTENANASIDVESKRIGDWYFDNKGVAHVVDNSLTDIANKYSGVVGASPLQKLTIRDYINVGISAAGAGMMSGKVLGAAGAVGGAVIAGFNAVSDAKEAYMNQYLNQDVEIVKAYNTVTDEDGKTKVFVDPNKLASIGSVGSGEGALKYVDTSQTDLKVNDDGSIDIKVSTAFLNSDEYQDSIKHLDELFGNGFSKEVASRIANEETGATYEDQMRDYIKAQEADFYYKAQSIANFKRIAPNASEEALEQACNTQLVGSLNNETLGRTEIAIYDENNEKKTVNARDYIEEIKNKSNLERNDYMLNIGNRIANSNVSDDEKVILQAQANALYGVSNNEDSGFKNIYKDGFWDSFADANMPIVGRIGNFVGVKDLEAFERNDLYGSFFDLVSFWASMKMNQAVTNRFENLIRSGVAAAGEEFGSDFLSNINKLAPNGQAVAKPGTVLLDGSTMTFGKYLAASGAQVALQFAADVPYDAIEWAAHKATGQDYDFAENLKRDFLIDTLMTYGPGTYRKAMETARFGMVKDPATGKKIVMELTPEVQRMVKARMLLDAGNGNAAIKTKEILLNKREALANVALMAVEAAPKNTELYNRMLRMANGIDDVTKDITAEFEMSSKDVQQHWADFNKALFEVTGGTWRGTGKGIGAKSFSKADMNYLNAKINRRRFVRMAGKNKKRVMQVVSFYKPSIEGVSKERAAQLDKLLGTMEVVIRDTVDYYHENGMVTDEEYDRMVNSDVYKNGEFMPVWSSKNGYKGGDIMQSRRAFAEVKDSNMLYNVEDFDSPLDTYARFVDNQMRNVAIQRIAETVLEVAAIPGSRISVVSDVVIGKDGKVKADSTESALGETEMLSKYEPRFKEIANKIVERVNKDIKTEKEHNIDNSNAVMESSAMEDVEKLKGLQEEESTLRGEVTSLGKKRKRLQREIETLRTEGQRIYNEGWISNEAPRVEVYRTKAAYSLSEGGNVSREELASHNVPKGTIEAPSYVENAERPSDYGTTGYANRGKAPSDLAYETKVAKERLDSALKKRAELEANGWRDDLGRDWTERTGVLDENGNPVAYKASNAEKLDEEISLAYERYNDLLAKSKGDVYGDELEFYSDRLARAEEELAKTEEDIDFARFNLARNRGDQQEMVETLYNDTIDLLVERDTKNKYAPKADISSLHIKDGIENALKSNNKFGALQVFLEVQVEAVNPYVSKESAIKAKTAVAAEKFRKTIIKEERLARKGKKGAMKTINAAADAVLDALTKGLDKFGSKEETNTVDTEDMAGFLKTYDGSAPRTLRYYVNGEQHYVTLEGQGVEAIISELYAPEASLPTTTLGKAGAVVGRVAGGVATVKRTLTTAADIARVMPNLMRDWTRGIVSTGGRILLDPDALRQKALESGKYSEEEIERINDAFLLARSAISRSTFTQAFGGPRRNVARQMIRQSYEGSQDKTFARRTLERKDMTTAERRADLPSYIHAGFVHFRTDLRTRSFTEKLSLLQDWAETYTRKKAMDTAYYSELAAAAGRGETVDEQIRSATEAAFFAGREATTNFSRRGALIEKVARLVPYLSQKFSSPQSLAYAYLQDPVAVANSMRATVGGYTALIAIALSNEEARKKYYLLSEYDRANNIIIPLTNDSIVTIPLDENVAAFLTPYRRLVEALEGNDPSGFYLWGVDFLSALSPLDLSGFSEGDKFNLRRGLEKMSTQVIPTVLMPFIENATGHDWYYGTDLVYDAEKTGMYYDNPDPDYGEMTSSSKNSKTLAAIANALGVPQWRLQNILAEFGGNVGQYALSAIDKLQGATDEETGGKSALDAVFKPFTGADSDEARTQFYDGINRLNEEKKTLQKKVAKIDKKLEAASGEEKAKLEQERQKLVTDYGLRVTDFVDQYLSAFEVTGGLSKKEANTVFFLYDIHGEASNADTYRSDSLESYYNDLIKKRSRKRTTALASESGLDEYVNSAMNPYYETYGAQALQNSVYGYGTDAMAKVAVALEDTSDYDNSYTKLKNDVKKRYDAAMDKGDYDTANAIAYEYDLVILRAIAPQLQEAGLEQTLKNSHAVTDYLEDWIYVPTDYYKTANGRWLSKLPSEVSKRKAYNRRFILDMFDLLDEED